MQDTRFFPWFPRASAQAPLEDPAPSPCLLLARLALLGLGSCIRVSSPGKPACIQSEMASRSSP